MCVNCGALRSCRCLHGNLFQSWVTAAVQTALFLAVFVHTTLAATNTAAHTRAERISVQIHDPILLTASH